MIKPNLTRAELQSRFSTLSEVLYWSLKNDAVLSVGQRICINQERAAIYRCLDQLTEGKVPVLRYKIPAHLEQKVRFIAEKIYANYEPFKYKFYEVRRKQNN